MAKIIAFGSGKGRVGKTTLILCLAYLRAKKVGNENFVLLDADSKTHSARVWASIRAQNESLFPILIVKADGGKEFVQQIDLYIKKGYDILIDVGADNEKEFNASLMRVQKMFVPQTISYMDTFQLADIDNRIGNVKAHNWNPELEAFLYPSMLSTNKLMIADDLIEVKELTKDLENIQLIEAHTKDRKAFRRMIKYGKTVFELLPDKIEKFDQQAVDEVLKFYETVYGEPYEQ